jgi:hypothetical protein
MKRTAILCATLAFMPLAFDAGAAALPKHVHGRDSTPARSARSNADRLHSLLSAQGSRRRIAPQRGSAVARTSNGVGAPSGKVAPATTTASSPVTSRQTMNNAGATTSQKRTAKMAVLGGAQPGTRVLGPAKRDATIDGSQLRRKF